MPVDMKRYPQNWKAISHYIRFERAGGKCEWCGVKHGAIGARDVDGVWHDDDDIQSMNSGYGLELFEVGYPKIIKIILTTAHIGIPKYPGDTGDKSDKMDCRYNNLLGLCQKCHLNFDRDEHAANRHKTIIRKRQAKIAATGQMRLL